MPRKNIQLTAKSADRYALYEASVQDVDFDIAFIRRVFKREHGRDPMSLREDFCGTAALCAAWAKRKDARAIGLDLDPEPMAYGLEKHVRPLGAPAERVALVRRDVLEGHPEKVDVLVAFNFSYSVFKRRQDMLAYLRRAREGLAPGGAFMMDMHGGPDAQKEVTERRRVKGFTYVWEQEALDAITAEGMRYIHFEFRDGTKLRRAFAYEWRLWTLPEMMDLFTEAGFSRVDVYWEGHDGKGGGNGIFRKVNRAENEDSWIAYVVAWR